MIRDVLLHPHPALKTPSKEIVIESVLDLEPLRDLVNDMVDTMYDAPGYGLAANQIGENIRLFVMDATWNPDDTASRKHMVIINPEILEVWSMTDMEEGCLSLPGAFVRNERYKEVKLTYTDLDNKRHEDIFRNMAAYVVQHEMDHLNGKLFIDDFKPMRKQMALNKYKKYMRLHKKLKPRR